MTAASDPETQRALASLMAFWAEAGVNASYLDAPADRMAEGRMRLAARAQPAARPAPAPAPARPGAATDTAGAVARAVAAAAAADSLEALAAAIAAFDACPLRYQGATQAVFARGAPGRR